MGKINILDASSANMIAAGEVVDRPASCLKELLENSVDAKATIISVDLKNGGNGRIRVTDNGEGIERDDLPKTLYRHATSKIKTGYDIDGVKTLGFRGEALAAASSVSRMEIISKTRGSDLGSRLTSDETGVELYEAGCPDGTTVIVDDIFYNVPARRKFMKKDSAENSACLAVCEKLALSHPEVALTVFCDGNVKMRTPGDGKLYSVIHSVYGSDCAKTFSTLEYELDGISVSGYISKPESPRGTRSMQSFFINGRYVKTRTVQVALEEAYRSYIPSGKYPAAIINICLPYSDVDVNVHPAKTEVKFTDERRAFSAVYYGVKSVLAPKDEEDKPKTEAPAMVQAQKAEPLPKEEKPIFTFKEQKPVASEHTEVKHTVFSADIADDELTPFEKNHSGYGEFHSEETTEKGMYPLPESLIKIPSEQETIAPVPKYKLIGEAYNTFIFAEFDDKIMIVDKHAAHERFLYENLKNKKTLSVQSLMFPITVSLTSEEHGILLDNSEYLASFGFAIEDFGSSTVAIREVPSSLKSAANLTTIMEGFAHELANGSNIPFEEKVDKALYTVACKAAVKAHQITNEEDNRAIIDNILSLGLKYCPHGRPFIKEISKKELERYFDR